METITYKETALYRVEIQGRGGDDVHDEYFKEKKDAVLASAIDGGNKTPYVEIVFELSDGRYMKKPEYVRVSRPPSRKEMKALREQLTEGLTPAQRIIMGKAD